MEACSLGICKVCNKSMNEPRILPCHHSFCLKCLESLAISRDSSKCPDCRDVFLIPKEGMKSLKINEFIITMNDMMQASYRCDICCKIDAAAHCLDCTRNFCTSCLETHTNIPATSKHRIDSLRETPAICKIRNDYSICCDHSEYMTLYCEECHTLMCSYCMMSDHSDHKINHIVLQCDLLRNDLINKLEDEEKTLENIIYNFNTSQKVKDENEKKASELRKQIFDRGEYAKRIIDSLVSGSIKILDREFKHAQNDIESIMAELKHMEQELNASIAFLKHQIEELNINNFLSKSLYTVPEHNSVPECTNNFNCTFWCEKGIQITNFGMFQRNFDYLQFDIASAPKDDLLTPHLIDTDENILVILFNDNTTLNLYERKSLKLKSKHNMKAKLSCIKHLLLLDDMLFILGTYNYKYKIFKVDVKSICSADEHAYHQIFKLKTGEIIYGMSLTIYRHILLVFSQKLVHILPDGSPIQTLHLPVSVIDAVQIYPDYYAVCDGYKLIIINESGEIDERFNPCHLNSVDRSQYQMVEDIWGPLYVINKNECIMLDDELNILKHFYFDGDLRCFYYDQSIDRLVAFKHDGQRFCLCIFL